ncbi:hypothetical protein BC628DRAFT_1501971, partial [Trametes gibbosa]
MSQSTMAKDALQHLSRAEIQRLAKSHGVKANAKTSEIVENLVAIHQHQGESCSGCIPTQLLKRRSPRTFQGIHKPVSPNECRRVDVATPLAECSVSAAEIGATDRATITPSHSICAPSPAFGGSHPGELNQGNGEQTHTPSASEQWKNDIDEDDWSTSDADPDYQGPLSPWRQGNVFPEPDGKQSGISFVLRPVSVWPTVHGSTDGVNDEVGRDSDPTQAGPAPIHRPTFSELRATLARIAPLADGDVHAKERIREVGILVDTAEDRAAEVQEKVRKLQRLRLAIEQEGFAKIKSELRVEDRGGPTNAHGNKHEEVWRSHQKRSTDT